jgi:hypothetical protein
MFDRLSFFSPVAMPAQAPSPPPGPQRIEPAKLGSGADPSGGEAGRRNAAERDLRDRKVAPLPDPRRPTGPPPAFEANVIEAEREAILRGGGRAESAAHWPRLPPEQEREIDIKA